MIADRIKPSIPRNVGISKLWRSFVLEKHNKDFITIFICSEVQAKVRFGFLGLPHIWVTDTGFFPNKLSIFPPWGVPPPPCRREEEEKGPRKDKEGCSKQTKSRQHLWGVSMAHCSASTSLKPSSQSVTIT